MRLMLAWIALTGAAVLFLGWYVHKDDAQEEAECHARGGIFLEARSPVHACVQPAPGSEK